MEGPIQKIKRRLKRRRFEKAVKEFDGPVIHLTHYDLDAVTSNAITLRRYGKEDVFTIYTHVQGIPEKLELIAEAAEAREDEKSLLLSDLNFDGDGEDILDLCRRIRGQGWSIEWRDHHPWSDEVLERFEEELDYLRVADDEIAGCEVVYQDLMPEDEISAEIAAIGRDRDLWINEDPRSEKLSTVLTGVDWKNRVSEMMAEGEYWSDELQERYEELERRKNEEVRESVEEARVVENGHRIGVTRSHGYNSDTAHEIRQEFDTDLEIVVSERGTFSLRSDHGVCTEIAEQHNGGGHPNASGGKLEFNLLDKLLFRVRGPSLSKVQELIETGQRELDEQLPRSEPEAEEVEAAA